MARELPPAPLEVPVPGRRLEADVVFGREVTLDRPDQADEQEQRSDDHVKAVKARRHVEVRAVDVAREAEGGVAVFISLEKGEEHAENDREDKPVDQVLAVVFMHQRVVGPGDGRARQQQDQRVDQRQVPGVEGFDPHRRPDAVDRGRAFRHRIHRVLEEAPEPREEEHHLRHDEEDEAVAQADAHHRRVISGLGFVHHVGPPGEHDVEREQQPDGEHPGGDPLHPEHRAEQHDESADRRQQRVQRGRQNVVVVVFRVSHFFRP